MQSSERLLKHPSRQPSPVTDFGRSAEGRASHMKPINILPIIAAFLISACGQPPDVRVQGDLRAIAGQLDLYKRLTGSFPTTDEGLQALVERPPSAPPRWNKLLQQLPLDPWARNYQYRYLANSSLGFELYSIGPEENSPDDDIYYRKP